MITDYYDMTKEYPTLKPEETSDDNSMGFYQAKSGQEQTPATLTENKEGGWKYPVSSTKMYRFVKDRLEHVASSNHPRLCHGDIVSIVGFETYGTPYWDKQDIKCYIVKVHKKLSLIKRKDMGKIIGMVPETCLEPYDWKLW